MVSGKSSSAISLILRPLVLGVALALATPALASLPEAGAEPPRQTWRERLHEQIHDRHLSLDNPALASAIRLLAHDWDEESRAILSISNCDDSGPGSLRDVIDNANSGDTVDMGAMACSVITLTTGALVVDQQSLRIQGGGAMLFTEDDQQLIMHNGDGLLELEDVTLRGGAKYTSDPFIARGGCIRSSGSVALIDGVAKYCTVRSTGSTAARGGAISAVADVSLINSVIIKNTAQSGTGDASGGGIYAGGSLLIEGSTVRDNEVITNSSLAHAGMGGGVQGMGDISIIGSTISGNQSRQAAGVSAAGSAGEHSFYAVNSTIANNQASASRHGGGMHLAVDGTLRHTTISGNVEQLPSGSGKYGGGIAVDGGRHLTMEHTVLSGNLASIDGTSFDSDLGRTGSGTVTFFGWRNLIGFTAPAITVPSHWPRGTDPGLGPLANNGGPTRTMMPLKGSPLINVGEPVAGFKYDQRGDPHRRMIGSKVDIGAVETDTLFADGFQ